MYLYKGPYVPILDGIWGVLDGSWGVLVHCSIYRIVRWCCLRVLANPEPDALPLFMPESYMTPAIAPMVPIQYLWLPDQDFEAHDA